MAKDVTNSILTEIKVDFTPAAIKVDYEAVEKQLAAIVSQYTGYEVTPETYKADYDERTRLNKLKEALEKKRKEINAEISKPYKGFKKWYDETVKPLDEAIGNITAGLNAVDEHERVLRVDIVRAMLEDKCMVAGLEKSAFADKYDEYSLKKYFKTGKFELKKSTLNEFDALVLAEFDKLEAYKASVAAIEDQAQEYDLPAEGYIRHLADGKTLVDVLKIMKQDRDAMTLRKEQQEARAKAEAERLAEIERMAQENAAAAIKAVDAETGEILEDVETASPEPVEPITVDLRLTLHGGKPQLKQLQEWLEDSFISFETLED